MKSNPELETTRHMKNCIHFIGRHEICMVWDGGFLVTLPFPAPENVSPPYERLHFANRARNLFDSNERTTMSPQRLI